MKLEGKTERNREEEENLIGADRERGPDDRSESVMVAASLSVRLRGVLVCCGMSLSLRSRRLYSMGDRTQARESKYGLGLWLNGKGVCVPLDEAQSRRYGLAVTDVHASIMRMESGSDGYWTEESEYEGYWTDGIEIEH
ncbi:hypothetical protein DY000_02020092 [Brassica cretica]|uniref:Uncharacterized protein n=1 Tax=Brassica cretica TaxID=69181 RepID=A0ABQ7ECI9_BRACR|nr:hypothetical protein DY000_02020092 [Brassica cretica]